MLKPVVPAAGKKCFDLYVTKQIALASNERIGNFELAKRDGVRVVERAKSDAKNTSESYRRTVSATVSRQVKKAANMTESASNKIPITI